MPDDLKIEGDKRFFTAALDRADLVVHGRHSQEEQPNASKRRRLILTGKVAAIAPDPDNPKALLWNPAGCTFETASREAGVSSGTVAIISVERRICPTATKCGTCKRTRRLMPMRTKRSSTML